MSLIDARQTRIFVPISPPFDTDDWYEQVLGNIINPLLQKYEQQMNWLWFTRYVKHIRHLFHNMYD